MAGRATSPGGAVRREPRVGDAESLAADDGLAPGNDDPRASTARSARRQCRSNSFAKAAFPRAALRLKMMASGMTSSIRSLISRGSACTRSTEEQALSAARKSRLNCEIPPKLPNASVSSICTRTERRILGCKSNRRRSRNG